MTDVDLSGPAPIGLGGQNGLDAVELPASPNAAAAVDAARTGYGATQKASQHRGKSVMPGR